MKSRFPFLPITAIDPRDFAFTALRIVLKQAVATDCKDTISRTSRYMFKSTVIDGHFGIFL